MPMSRNSIRKVTATARREANIALKHHIKGHMWTVWYYELATRTNKVFKVNRISNVEIKSERWENETHHRQGKMYIFRMTGDTPVDFKLQLSLMAKNILVEEYPDAERYLIPTDDDDVWMLDTQVYRMEGLGRFYMGLAGEIQIIDTNGVKEYAQKYSKDYIE